MTALVGVFGAGAAAVRESVSSMLEAMAPRGRDGREEWHGPDAVVAAASHAWEAGLGGWTGPLVHETDDLVVASDASLYYVSDLRRKLSRFGVVTRTMSSGALIALAVRAWGDHVGEHLEGDWAIVAWDKARRRLIVTRDLVGRRGLYVARLDASTVIVASSPHGILAAPGMRATYDVDAIASLAAGLPADTDRTAFADIRWVPAGVTLAGEPDRVRRVSQLRPPVFSDDWGSAPTGDAIEELRHLLADAVAERLPQTGAAAVWMSGGWDSTSVFASGRDVIARRSLPVDLRPVSLQFPVGDVGNEDRYIHEIARRWHADVSWLPVDRISLFGDANRQVRLQDDLLAHPFQEAQRALASVSQALGARVALDGLGGDALFMSSDAVLADHLLRSRLGALAQGWRRRRNRSPRAFVKTVCHPLLPYEFVDWLRETLGVRVRGRLEFAYPAWMIPRESLRRGARPAGSREPLEAVTSWEARFLLTNQYFSRLFSCTQAHAADAGIQVRSPLMDGRLLAFASRRPLNERQHDGEAKVLLRLAMRELLPDAVLARRMTKTGTTTDYVVRQVRQEIDGVVAATLEKPKRLQLEELGVIDRQKLQGEIARFRSGMATDTAGPLLSMVLAERWLACRGERR